jgi:RNA polymerase II subunit A C-terminal domain phosphatase SSU72
MSELTIATVCASNMNRSMAAHKSLRDAKFNVHSFGTGQQVRLPGPTINRPNVYNFGTAYKDIIQDLVKKDERLYNQNGLLSMLSRNEKIKQSPQRWMENNDHHDIVYCFEDRVFDSVVEDFMGRDTYNSDRAVHVINMNTKDNNEEALKGADQCLKFIQLVARSDDWESELSNIIARFEKESQRKLLHCVFYD